jgi:predicted metalloprotease
MKRRAMSEGLKKYQGELELDKLDSNEVPEDLERGEKQYTTGEKSNNKPLFIREMSKFRRYMEHTKTILVTIVGIIIILIFIWNVIKNPNNSLEHQQNLHSALNLINNMAVAAISDSNINNQRKVLNQINLTDLEIEWSNNFSTSTQTSPEVVEHFEEFRNSTKSVESEGYL